MLFYKVLLQEERKTLPLYKKLGRNDFLIGNYQNSYAIPYSPEKFSKWLNENRIYTIFVHDSIKQALINNNKFSYLISISESLNISMIDCQFENIDLSIVLEGEELETDVIEYILKHKSFRLLKVTFRSENNFIISVKRNGVIEIDEDALLKDKKVISNLLDVLNLGYGAIL